MAENGQWTDLVSDFVQYTETTPTTEIHRVWSGISLVGGALGRKVWTRAVGNKRTYANLYVMLVGPPGVGKGIIDEVKAFWQDAVDPTGGKAFHVASDSVTRASLIDELANAKLVHLAKDGPPIINHTLLVASEEFQVLLPTFDPHMVSILNGLWNNKDTHYESRRHGPAKEVKITNPQLSIIGGMQPSYLADFPDQTWNTGLIRRIVMVYVSEGRTIELFQNPAGLPRKKAAILKRLGQISLLYGQAKWREDAAAKINEWHLNGREPEPNHSKLQVYNASRTEFLVKLALISAISRTMELVIELTDVNRAMAWLFNAEEHMPDIFRAMLGKSDASVLEELHFFVTAQVAKQKQKPVPTASIVNFLLSRVPADKIPRMMEVAERANIIARLGGTESWIPRPRHQHGVE